MNFLRVGAVISLCFGGVLGLNVANAGELDAGKAMEIYRTIDGWVRQWEVGEAVDEGLMREAACVSVTLRFDGRVIGRGQVVGDGPDRGTVVVAARGAMSEARAWVRARLDQEPTAEFWDSVAQRVVVSVELADRTVPMSEGDLGSPGLGLSPGVHGLVMRLGERYEVMSPDEMITLGTGVERGAYTMATALSGDGGMAVASIGDLVSRGYRFERFEPIWIAQQGEGAGAVFLDRGGRVIEETGFGARSVRSMSERIAGYLIAQRWPGSERFGMVGTRDVVSGRADPEVAPVYEQALSAYALLRFAEMGQKAIHEEAREEGVRILTDLGVVQPGEAEPWDVRDGGVGAAACVIALSHEQTGVVPDEWITLREKCEKTLSGLYSPIDGFDASVPDGARGLVAWALVRSGSQYASSAVRAVFRDTEPGLLVSQMPFLGWAELELAEGLSEVPASGAMETMRTWMWVHQLGKTDLEWRDRDFVGSVVFTKGSSVLPTSGNVRPIAIACTMLGDERLSPGTVAESGLAGEIGRVASAMRFVDQLVMSESSGFLSRTPERCVGGVRSSLWEWRVSPATSAVALLAAVEFERSIRAIGARGMGGGQP